MVLQVGGEAGATADAESDADAAPPEAGCLSATAGEEGSLLPFDGHFGDPFPDLGVTGRQREMEEQRMWQTEAEDRRQQLERRLRMERATVDRGERSAAAGVATGGEAEEASGPGFRKKCAGNAEERGVGECEPGCCSHAPGEAPAVQVHRGRSDHGRREGCRLPRCRRRPWSTTGR